MGEEFVIEIVHVWGLMEFVWFSFHGVGEHGCGALFF